MKKLLNKKILLGSSSILTCLGLIILCSFISINFDLNNLGKGDFWVNQAFIITITIFSLISVMFIGQAGNAQDGNSNLAKARVSFFANVIKIININAFSQWIKNILQPRDIKAIKERKMRMVGIEDYSILDLEYSQIKSLLETPQKYGDKYYKGISQKQIDTILEIKRKGIKVELVEPDYYLTVKSITNNRTITERSSKEGYKKSLFLARSVIFKVLITLLSAMIITAFFYEASKSDMGDPKVWGQLVARLLALVSSSFMGYIVGCQINDIDAEYIEMRIVVQNMFLQDKDFKPIDTQEEAKQEFIERVKKEQVLQIEKRDIV